MRARTQRISLLGRSVFSFPSRRKHGALNRYFAILKKHRFSIGSKVFRWFSDGCECERATEPQGMSRKVVQRDPDSLRA